VDPIELLDILGNENRRRILQLLSFRPFYFSEIARRLDVGPKAVIDHLEILEKAGIIEVYTDQSRRKYFRIASNVTLEIALSPNTYGIRTYRSLAINSGSAVRSVEDKLRDAGSAEPNGDEDEAECDDLGVLQEELTDLEERRRVLRQSLAELDSRECMLKAKVAQAIKSCMSDPLEMEILLALLSGGCDAQTLARRLEVPVPVVMDMLGRLQAKGAVCMKKNGWRLASIEPLTIRDEEIVK
jgi:ArsR family transcriptional regulator